MVMICYNVTQFFDFKTLSLQRISRRLDSNKGHCAICYRWLFPLAKGSAKVRALFHFLIEGSA